MQEVHAPGNKIQLWKFKTTERKVIPDQPNLRAISYALSDPEI